jgi:hypothetical protein
MKILNESTIFGEKQIAIIEEKYNAKYVFETCLRARDGGWANFPAAVFYQEEAYPGGSNYFAMYFGEDGNVYITDAGPSIIDEEFTGLEAEGEVVYSRYRHDYRAGKNGAFVDGGRDYFRYGGDKFDDYNIVKFRVEKDHLEVSL